MWRKCPCHCDLSLLSVWWMCPKATNMGATRRRLLPAPAPREWGRCFHPRCGQTSLPRSLRLSITFTNPLALQSIGRTLLLPSSCVPRTVVAGRCGMETRSQFKFRCLIQKGPSAMTIAADNDALLSAFVFRVCPFLHIGQTA